MIKTKQLRIAAEELIEVLLLTEKDAKGKKVPVVIDEEATVEEMTKIVRDAIPLIEEGDDFTDETQAVIDELKEDEDEEPAPKKKAKPAPADDDDDEDAPPPKKKAVPVDDDDDDDGQAAAEKIHKKNVASKPTRTAPEEDDDEDEPPVKKKKVVIPDNDLDDDDPDAEEEKPKKAAKKEPKEKKERVPSAYGTAVSIMTKTPDITIAELNKKLVKLGIDVEGGKSAVQTGFGVVRKIVKELRENGLME